MELNGLVLDYGGVMTDPGEAIDPGGEFPMASVVRRARHAGIRTALLSNADTGPEWPDRSELFDVIVLSGVVGMAKPDVEIYRLTARKLGVAPYTCVFVDDLRSNVSGAVATGMVGVHHSSISATIAELEILFPVLARC
ncbi:HAD-IA family hydrolase [Haloactinomyces albus]|uniref:HAD superfamily hydrolase (TIGR01509 family) n=1 Tax=Haloactinomyces albus TaxID=1352928 RepID=A0AAE3ZDL1_9ACTN|nr:HAD-IA family hydrolase [Haloactinomyces albus]MDR7301282.1 HAD superfamily hydrolase (TIGR01509 family) [Haloactinomyces albus]